MDLLYSTDFSTNPWSDWSSMGTTNSNYNGDLGWNGSELTANMIATYGIPNTYAIRDTFAPRLNQEVSVSIYPNIHGTKVVGFGVGDIFEIEGTGTGATAKTIPTAGVYVEWNYYNGSGNLWVNGTRLRTGFADSTFYNRWQRLKVRYEDGIVYAKSWPVGSGEPGWQGSHDISSYGLSESQVILGFSRSVSSSSATIKVDDVEIYASVPSGAKTPFRGWGIPAY